MRSGIEVIFLLLAICTLASQQPLISSDKANKGLKGILPNEKLYSLGLSRVVYYYDQAVAVIDINESNEMQDCDIIEVYEPSERTEILRNLSSISQPTKTTFEQMTKLMSYCQTLEAMQPLFTGDKDVPKGPLEHVNLIRTNALNLFAGIVPGTKWCGIGDVADNYHDLGINSEVDKCCRTHDLCPVKIRAHRTRYNLTNNSLYSKSHCDCDSTLYHCLKQSDSPSASIMGKLYFNIIKVGCIEDLPRSENALSLMTPTKRFVQTQLSY